MAEQGEGQAAFNPALEYVRSIARLIDLADGFFLQEDYREVYKILDRIYNRVEHKFEPRESEKIEGLQKEIIPKLNKLKPKESGEVAKKLGELDRILKRYMNKHGLLIPSKSDPRFAIRMR